MLEFKPITKDSRIVVGTILKLSDNTLCVVGDITGLFKHEVGSYYTENPKEKTETFGLIKLSEFGTAYDYSQEELIKPDFEFLRNDSWNSLKKDCLSESYWRWPVEYCNFLVEILD